MSTEQDRIRTLLTTAANASKQLEESVRELVSLRAWEVLGYENFAVMWETECGFKLPKIALIIAVDEFGVENKLSRRSISKAVGRDYGSSSFVSSIFAQLDAQVPMGKVVVTANPAAMKKAIELHGSRTGNHPRRSGAGPTDLVPASVTVFKRDDDLIKEIARQTNVPKAEIYRQAVAEYLMRIKESR